MLVHGEHVRLHQEATRAGVHVAEQQRRQAGAAGVVPGVVDEVAGEGERAARIRVRQWRGVADHPAVAVLQLVPALDLHEGVFHLVVDLLRVHGQKVRTAGETREVGHVHVRQAGRDVVDVDAHDAERRRRLRPVVGLGREGEGAGVADAQLVHEAHADDLRVVEGQAVCGEARVLDAGHERPEIESGRRLRRCRQTARRLPLRRVELELPVGPPHEERIVVAHPVVDAARHLVLGHLAVGRGQVVVEVPRLIGLRVDARDVPADRVNAILRNDVAREQVAQELRVGRAHRCAGIEVRIQARRERIVDLDQRARRRVAEVAEVADARPRRRHGVDERQAAGLLQARIVGEEERAVGAVVEAGNDQRTADGAAELVPIERRLRQLAAVRVPPLREVVVRVEDVVPDEIEHRPVPFVAARLGGHRDDARAPAEFGREHTVQDLELAHRLDRRRDDDRVEGELVVVDAVDEPAVGVRLLAEGVEVRGAARVERARSRQVLARLPRRHARHEVDQRREVAAVERQLADGLLLDDRADLGRLGLDQGRPADDRRHLGELADVERDVHACPVVDLHDDALPDVLAEA